MATTVYFEERVRDQGGSLEMTLELGPVVN